MGKKVVYILLLCSACTLPVFSDVKEDFDEIVDFSMTLELINRAAAAQRTEALASDKAIIIDGAISTIQILDTEPDTFSAELEIVDGEWIGFEDVQMYSCIVEVNGPEFAARIPARRSRRAIPDEITVNSHVIVIARFTGLREIPDEYPVAVLEGYYIRTID